MMTDETSGSRSDTNMSRSAAGPRVRTVTTESIGGEMIDESLGTVRGNTVRARNVRRDITQLLRNIVGGELKAYTTLFSDSRAEAGR